MDDEELKILLDEMGLKSRDELIELIKDEICNHGYCFKPEDDLEIIATSWIKYVEYAEELLEDICGDCYKMNLTIDPESFADMMLSDTVYYAEIERNGKTYEFYVRLR